MIHPMGAIHESPLQAWPVTVHPEPFDSPFVLSLWKDKWHAQDMFFEGYQAVLASTGSCFDALRTNGLVFSVLTIMDR